MNSESSRSHLVLSIIIESTNKTTGSVLKGKVRLIYLVTIVGIFISYTYHIHMIFILHIFSFSLAWLIWLVLRERPKHKRVLNN